MNELRRITSLRWDTGSEEIRFDVTSGEERIKCRVSSDYLEERFGPLRNIDDFFSGAAAFRSEILLAVKKQIDMRQIETDGSLLLLCFGYVPVT
jgi:hypothetical protein